MITASVPAPLTFLIHLCKRVRPALLRPNLSYSCPSQFHQGIQIITSQMEIRSCSLKPLCSRYVYLAQSTVNLKLSTSAIQVHRLASSHLPNHHHRNFWPVFVDTRSTLTKDKSTFDSMFSLDLDLRSHTGTGDSSIGPEGESDDNPIRLQGDSADEFRALLWALYALYVHNSLSDLSLS